MYARGILFGKMKYELGDHSFVRCPELDLVADIDFKTKGWVSGTYNAIGGVIKRESTGEVLYELSGLWSDEMFIKDVQVSLESGGRFKYFYAEFNATSRLDTRTCSSMRPQPSQVHPRSDQWLNRKSGNLKGFGGQPPRQSRKGIMKWPPTKRPRSKTDNERRLQPGHTMALIGTHVCSDGSRATTMLEMISNGSSILPCT
jgi:hypothetical protein